ncbi:MAG: tripartite tricarboxylate transporter substrate binding protein [Burkholderiales bacterium]|nr:tripartite tricarboxylate transporter substrate binding protein [Burkholderiales bacterium]
MHRSSFDFPAAPLPAVLAAALSATALFAAAPALAQAWPAKPIRFIVTLAPGSASDIVARLSGEPISKALGQPVVVENRVGGGGVVAAEFVMRAPPDGYTMLVGSIASHGINPALMTKIPYDALKDFAPVVSLASSPNVLIASTSLPVKSVKDLIALARKRPGELTYASGGNGTSHHMGGELFGMMSGTKMSHIPFKGSPQAVGAVVSGEVALMFPNIPNAMGLAKAGKVRILGVTTPKRLSFWPELPTIAESGLPGYEVIAWFGLFSPAGTPSAVIDRMNAEANKALAIPAVRESLMTQGFELMGGTVAEFAAFVRSEIDKWAKVVKATGAKAE